MNELFIKGQIAGMPYHGKNKNIYDTGRRGAVRDDASIDISKMILLQKALQQAEEKGEAGRSPPFCSICRMTFGHR